MKTLTIAISLGFLALPAAAQYPNIVVRDQPEDPYPTVILPPPSPEPISSDDTWDEDGYDVEADVYYDTVAAENYDDGYDPNAYQQFQGALSPYGSWMDDPNYGQVWLPSSSVVGADFSPYGTGGHWIFTDNGWSWMSDFDWGWAPFHYGRWIDLTGWGWAWVPGTVWGPGWVSWRCGGGYAGWAPLPPRGVTVGPPRGIRSPWRFTLSHEVGVPRPRFLPAGVMPAVFAKTSVITSLRGSGSARFNAGPAPSLLHAQVHAVPHQQLGPRALPHASITPRPGLPLQARPWVRNPPRPLSIPIRPVAPGPRSITLGNRMPVAPRPYVAPVYRAPAYRSPMANTPAPMYRPPMQTYHPPTQTYRPPMQSYRPPATMYQQPAYRAPAYNAPTYHAPAPVYRAPAYNAPAYHSAPTYHSAPAPAPSYRAPAPTYHAPAPAASHFGGGGGGRHR